MPHDPRVDAYIARQADFARPILVELRRRIHAACPDAEEAIKWGMPAFLHAGRPLAHMAAFKAHASFGFWDREGMATGREGEAMGQYGRLTAIDDLPGETEFARLVAEAVARIDSGAKPARGSRTAKPEADVPEALADALANDDAAAAMFDDFPPGARREYCEWIAEAKREETRTRRVAQAIEWLREGKRRNWKYENC